MNITNNTILITGGGSGIGRALAEALHARGNRVIVTGRREAPLAEAAAANPGMTFATLDITDPAAIRAFAAKVVKQHPALNVVVNNAGIMKAEQLTTSDLDSTEVIVATSEWSEQAGCDV